MNSCSWNLFFNSLYFSFEFFRDFLVEDLRDFFLPKLLLYFSYFDTSSFIGISLLFPEDRVLVFLIEEAFLLEALRFSVVLYFSFEKNSDCLDEDCL